MFQTETEISTTAVLPELVVLVYLFLNLLGFCFNLVKHKPLWNLKLRSALPLGRFNLFVYVSPAVQAFYPPTTTLLNILLCYVQCDTLVSWGRKSCSVNYFLCESRMTVLQLQCHIEATVDLLQDMGFDGRFKVVFLDQLHAALSRILQLCTQEVSWLKACLSDFSSEDSTFDFH